MASFESSLQAKSGLNPESFGVHFPPGHWNFEELRHSPNDIDLCKPSFHYGVPEAGAGVEDIASHACDYRWPSLGSVSHTRHLTDRDIYG